MLDLIALSILICFLRFCFLCVLLGNDGECKRFNIRMFNSVVSDCVYVSLTGSFYFKNVMNLFT